MDEKISQLENKIHELEGRISARDSQQIVLPVDSITQSILAGLFSLKSKVLYGQIALIAGTITITDSRIKTTSVIVVTATTSGHVYGASTAAGSATIGSTDASYTDTLNYIIIL